MDYPKTYLSKQQIEDLIRSIICKTVNEQPLSITVPGVNLEWLYEVSRELESLQNTTILILRSASMPDDQKVKELKRVYASLMKDKDEKTMERFIERVEDKLSNVHQHREVKAKKHLFK